MEIGAVIRAKVGESACGDAWVAVDHEGSTLIALADGLGHGPEAARAAKAACDHVAAHPGPDLNQLMKGCDRALASTRGAALSLLYFDRERHELTHAGVGNVELQAVSRAAIHPPNSPGVVGIRLRRIMVSVFALSPGDLLAVFTDGVSSRYRLEAYRALPVQAAAEAIVREHGKDHDDASCLIIRY
jgi:phosphoserine phosphatase RsbX